MLRDTTVVIVRHAEKSNSTNPALRRGLSAEGRERAEHYMQYFQQFRPWAGEEPLKLDYVFGAANGNDSCRSQLTLLPLASELNLPIFDAYKDKRYRKLAAKLRKKKNSEYNGKTLLICWHHGKAFALADALVRRFGRRRHWPTDWPQNWPDEVYDRILVIAFGQDGHLDEERTKAVVDPFRSECDTDPVMTQPVHHTAQWPAPELCRSA
jgi:broad specificity phosphatase PhoE